MLASNLVHDAWSLPSLSRSTEYGPSTLPLRFLDQQDDFDVISGSAKPNPAPVISTSTLDPG